MDKALLDHALNYLSSRPRSVHEVRSKLKEKQASAEQIEEVVEYLKSKHFLDDRALAEQMTTFRVSQRLWGPVRVARDLKRRGIDATMIDSVLAVTYEEHDEDGLLAAAIEKWTAKKGPPRTPRQLKNLFDRLQRNGFRAGRIRKQLNSLFKEIDWNTDS